MKLEPKAKPVRIRIKSGGEEHFSVDSLKRNFSVQELWEAVTERSLSRWLKQQNEKELAEKVDSFCQIKKPSPEDYIRFSGLFFEKELGGLPFEDAHALFRFYQDKNLVKNLRYAFSYLSDAMEVDYKTGRAWFDAYEELKTVGDWINFFKTKRMHLERVEEVEYYFFLSQLYEKNGDLKEMEDCQSNAMELINGLVKEDIGYVDELLKTNEFFFIKVLFENRTARNSKNDKDWIAVFEHCEDQLKSSQQAECCYFLYSLYKTIGDKDQALACLEKSSSLGFEKATKDLFVATHSYPKLTEVLDRYRSDNKRLSVSDLDNISRDINKFEKEDKYYALCKYGIKTLKDHQPISDPIRRKAELRSQETIRISMESLMNTAITCGFPEFKSIVVLIGALSFEQQFDSVELFKRYSGKLEEDSPYNLIFDLKKNGQKGIIVSEKRLKCDLNDASIVEQLFFFLETHGERYSILNQE